MKRNTLLVTMLVALVAAIFAAGGYWFGMRRMHTQMSVPTAAPAPSTLTQSDKAGATNDRRVLYWHDPMVPGPKFDKPGKSPFMNMDLVPVYADEGASEGKVTISPRTAQNLGIRIAEVKEGRMNMGLATTGVVNVDERSLIAVQARVNGYIEKLYVRAQYDGVSRGQPLVDIYSPEWLAAQEEYLVLKRSTQPGADALVQAARQRLSLLGISEVQIQRMEQSDRASARVTLYAPEGGVVWELGVRDGMAVNSGLTLFRLASLGSVWVNADVPETEAAMARPGATVEARAAAFPDTVYKGSVATLLPDVSATTRTIKARIVLANPGGKLRPGMFVNVNFGAGDKPALMVPSEAVIHTGKRSLVIVAEEGGKFHPVEIEAGRDSGDMIEVRKGLIAGQKVVASGQFLIDSEASLKSTLNRLESAKDVAPNPSNNAAKDTPHTGIAKVNAVNAATGMIELSHDPMPSMKWPAMTMGFRAEDKSLLSGVKAGDEIEFDIRGVPDKNGDFVITRIAPKKVEGREMIARLIRWSIDNRFLVLVAAAIVTAWGLWSALRTPLDALPDLSDTQVIIRTTWPGQAPQIVEDQVTYPLTTTMLSVPGAKTVRGYSFFGDSFVYVLFEDGVDLYWARSRVLEYLSQVQGRLPRAAKAAIGPDATGVGWIYEYAVVDRSGRQDTGQLRALQDWFLKYELKSVANVAEVASVGGMVRQYQIVLNPDRLRAYSIPISRVIQAVKNANQESGGSVLELGEAEYMVRARGYLKSLEDFRTIPIGLGEGGTPVFLKDVARIQMGPEMRRGIAELDGEGDTVGGIVVMRQGKNALETIAAIKAKIESLKPGLPPGVEIVPTYDRSELIHRAISHLRDKLTEEFIIVALVCAVFLLHLRSSLVAIITLPLGVLAAFIVMAYQGINANIMSLGGIAIAIGAMVDAAVVMIENAHKHLETWRHDHPQEKLADSERWRLIGDAATEVGPALFFSLLIITLSFVPVFALEAQEGRLFAPLAYTKSYAMAAAAGLSITLVPVLMGYWIRGRIPDEGVNPINKLLTFVYRPLLGTVLRFPKLTLVATAVVLGISVYPAVRLGAEFMPPLDEGDLLYMPTALPGLSAGKASEILQITDRLIRTIPEVARVFGKVGRADTATDPAPLEMVETTIQFKPKSQWRPGMTQDKLIEELDRTVRVPGLSNIWVPPIRNRIDMLATGIKSPLGIKVSGPDLATIERIASDIERAVKDVPGVTSALAERLTGGRYIDVTIDRQTAARYGMNIVDVQDIISAAIGGENIGETVEGLQRFPINVRYPRELRDSVEALRTLPVVTERGAQIPLGTLAKFSFVDGPPMLRSENARLSGWVYVDMRGRDLQAVVNDAQRAVREKVKLAPGYSIAWSGQFEYLERAKKRLAVVVPFTLAIIFMLLYLIFRSIGEALLIMAAVPFALVGGLWLIWLLGYNLSVAVAVGFIALAGVAAEFGVVMLIYLRHALDKRIAAGEARSVQMVTAAITEGALLRVRPKAMTVAVIMAGLLPIMWSAGTGGEVMQRIAAPMIGGMITAPLLSMLVIPAAYLLMRRRQFNRS